VSAVILVADDNPTIRSLFEHALLLEGYAVRVAEDGFATLAIINNRKVDLIIADIGLPHVDGIALIHRLRTHGNAIPIILTHVDSGRNPYIPGVPFLQQPVSFAELRELVARLLPR
jgi:DNA-binding response OmpR family regulator